MRLLLPLFLLSLIVLFFVSLMVPRKSKRLQSWIDDRLEHGQRKGERSAGRVGN